MKSASVHLCSPAILSNFLGDQWGSHVSLELASATVVKRLAPLLYSSPGNYCQDCCPNPCLPQSTFAQIVQISWGTFKNRVGFFVLPIPCYEERAKPCHCGCFSSIFIFLPHTLTSTNLLPPFPARH